MTTVKIYALRHQHTGILHVRYTDPPSDEVARKVGVAEDARSRPGWIRVVEMPLFVGPAHEDIADRFEPVAETPAHARSSEARPMGATSVPPFTFSAAGTVRNPGT